MDTRTLESSDLRETGQRRMSKWGACNSVRNYCEVASYPGLGTRLIVNSHSPI